MWAGSTKLRNHVSIKQKQETTPYLKDFDVDDVAGEE